MESKTSVNDPGLTFLFLDEADTVEALVSRILPGSPEDPGAREAGVLTYIDRALSGTYSRWQRAYREGVRTINVYTRQRYEGKKFFELSEEDQDEVLGALEEDSVPGFGEESGGTSGSEAFFTMIWAHTVEGMFSDPSYGGNRGASGWKLIGFPGAQYGYSEEEMRYGADISDKPIRTLKDIEKLAREKPEFFYKRPGPDPSVPEEETPEPSMPPQEPGEAISSG